MKNIKPFFLLSLFALLLHGCTSDECPLNDVEVKFDVVAKDAYTQKPLANRNIFLTRQLNSTLTKIIAPNQTDNDGKTRMSFRGDFACAQDNNVKSFGSSDSLDIIGLTNSISIRSYPQPPIELLFYRGINTKLRIRHENPLTTLYFSTSNRFFNNEPFFTRNFQATQLFDSTFVFILPINKEIVLTYAVSINNKTTSFSEKITIPAAQKDTFSYEIKY